MLYHFGLPLFVIISSVLSSCGAPHSLEKSSLLSIEYNAIEPLPSNAETLQKQRMPLFVFDQGTCSPSVPLDAEGRINRGLANTFDLDRDCEPLSASKFNIFLQIKQLGPYMVSMWALYFPKDGIAGVAGHRHDWERAYIWYKTDEAGVYRPEFVTYAQHRGWYTGRWPKVPKQGIRPIIHIGKSKHGMYHNPNRGAGGPIDAILYWTDTRARIEDGNFFPKASPTEIEGADRLVEVDKLPENLQNRLKDNLWEKANAPMKGWIWDQVERDMLPALLRGESSCSDQGCDGQSEEVR